MAEKRYTVVFLAAVIVALVATYGIFRAIRAVRMGSRVPMAAVVVAQRDIPEGHAIGRHDVDESLWPSASAPAGAFASLDSVVGRVTRVAVYTGEPIVPGRLAPVGTGAGIEVKITPGKRAMAIRIDEVAGMAGLIQPNSRVDVLVTMRDENGSNSNRRVAKTFMENMRVLSVGTQVFRGEDGKPIRAASATLEVTPDEAERLAIAVGTGPIQLVLRGYGDPDSIRTRGATSSDVLAQLREAPAAAPASLPDPPRHRSTPIIRRPEPVAAPVVTVVPTPVAPKRPDSVTVQVFRAGKVSQQHFERDSSSAPSPQ